MFLKSLTLKGFKSFADKTLLELEPGVTCVVGPNGSGKSNLVDAVAWVLGAQGPRTLRGGKMDDVIFAGTSGRAALGRAEVALTIDNTAGLLPIEFSEVTITRTLFRSGDSEYQINDAPCRLLDIQELLSDTGIGRQQHVIVGQGQLDAVLTSRPEDRRAVIEEAAGILKFRKRREKAERRLEATEGNLLRLNDLLREVRRGLAPLARQAEASRRHDDVAAEARAIRLHLAGHELAGLQVRLERLGEQDADLRRTGADVEARLARLDVAVLEAERALTHAGEDDLADELARAEALRARGRGLLAVVAERRRSAAREMSAAADAGVADTLVADAHATRAELAAVGDRARELDAREAGVAEAEAAAARDRAVFEAEDPGATPELDAEALRGELETRRRSLARSEAELERLSARAAAVAARVADAEAGVAIASAEHAEASRAAPPLERSLSMARDAHAAAALGRRASEDAVRGAVAEASTWRARADALALALDTARRDAGVAALEDLDGVVGALVEHLEIEADAEAAVASVLGDALGAVVVRGAATTRAALERLTARGDVHALLLVVDSLGDGAVQGQLAPPGTRALVECVRARVPGLDTAVGCLLAATVLVDGGWTAALDVALAHPGLTAVTRAGDRFGGRGPWRVGGHEPAVSRRALEDAERRAAHALDTQRRAEAAATTAAERLQAARDSESQVAEEVRGVGNALELASRERARAERELRDRATEHAALEDDLTRLRAEHERERAEVAERSARLPDAEAREREAATRASARSEVRARLEAREAATAGLRRQLDVERAALEERRALLAQRLAEVDERLARSPDAVDAARSRRDELARRDAAYRAVGERVEHVQQAAHRTLGHVRDRRRRQSEAAGAAGAKLDACRRERGQLERELAEHRERLQRCSVEQAEQRTRLEATVQRVRAEFDCEPSAALDAPRPELPEGTSLGTRARELERELRIMGPINPLAREEYEALQERHVFLQQQLEDVKSSRRELNRVIKAVDLEIVSVFERAFADVSEHFRSLFATLFPGGSGRLSLTDPANPLDTGIEIEARPSGKNVRRLSLLSGGERSLVALAFLFAVFRARPSPFYLLDEVEAALDDLNLHRFIDLVQEFRDEAQLLVVTHQKRTMEAADSLYGVSMAPGGSSKVVSQRMRGELVLD